MHVYTHHKNIVFHIMSMIFVDTYFRIYLGYVLVSIWFPFWHQCSCFGVLVFCMILVMAFLSLFRDFATQNRTPVSPPWMPGRTADPQNRVPAPPSFQGRFFVDSAPLVDRFGNDFEGFSARCSVVFCNILDNISV